MKDFFEALDKIGMEAGREVSRFLCSKQGVAWMVLFLLSSFAMKAIYGYGSH
jgi:hypothetical protein